MPSNDVSLFPILFLLLKQVWRVEATLSQNNDVKIPASKYFKASLSNGYLVTIIIVSQSNFSHLTHILDFHYFVNPLGT